MKHKPVKKMLKSRKLLPEDIANYAVMNTSDNDYKKTVNIVDLINRCVELEARHVKSKQNPYEGFK